VPPLDPDWTLRQAAFAALTQLVRRKGPVLAWADIDPGFAVGTEQVRFANRARGIFRPRAMRGAALSVKTTQPRSGRVARYDDGLLRAAHDLGAPLIYFFGIGPGSYAPLWPVYILHLDPAGLSCQLVVDPEPALQPGTFLADGAGQTAVRRYATVMTKRRLHQDAFRMRVLEAYQQRCAVCSFPGPSLLDAAHIVPDSEELGTPEVPNGLALCRLHHGAFDADMLGIDPGGVIHIAPRVLELRDGPTLEQGIKAFAGKALHQPHAPASRPSVLHLEMRYELFCKAG